MKKTIEAMISGIGVDAWIERRDKIERELLEQTRDLEQHVDAPRLWFEDRIAWYLYLCELAISNPYSLPTYYSSRVLPFFSAIGSKLTFRDAVEGFQEKLDETMSKRRRDPDGHVFEMLVALSYAESGWYVEFIPEGPEKTPDLRVKQGEVELLVECKRQSSLSDYAGREEATWRRHWERAVGRILSNRQWVWFDVVVHKELHLLPDDWFDSRLARLLPLAQAESGSSDEAATIRVRVIDKKPLHEDLQWSFVKAFGSKLRHLLGQDWVGENAVTSLLVEGKFAKTADDGVFSKFYDAVYWATGATFACDAENSIETKARDVKSLVARAVAQLPEDAMSIVHVGLETLEGPGVEDRRMRKVIPSLEQMTRMKNVQGVVVHSFQPVDSVDQLVVIDEPFSDFWRRPALREHVPLMVALPAKFALTAPLGKHWEIER
ncbi:hypothetical protein [Caballeronia sp. S22]|uniref:hypothetical protein n=1 Tax=Caballeronia sp. S22 TaxID=3137182 RepID=UPI003530AD98